MPAITKRPSIWPSAATAGKRRGSGASNVVEDISSGTQHELVRVVLKGAAGWIGDQQLQQVVATARIVPHDVRKGLERQRRSVAKATLEHRDQRLGWLPARITEVVTPAGGAGHMSEQHSGAERVASPDRRDFDEVSSELVSASR